MTINFDTAQSATPYDVETIEIAPGYHVAARDLPPPDGLVVGFCGEAYAGKDTAAREFQLVGFTVDHLAQPLYRAVSAMVGYDVQSTWKKTEVIPEMGVTLRYALQTLGTEWGRERIGEDTWVRLLANRWIRQQRWAPLAVPDVRFENEARWVNSHGILIRIVRPDNPHRIPRDHSSEAEWDKLPALATLTNGGTEGEFRRVCQNYARALILEQWRSRI